LGVPCLIVDARQMFGEQLERRVWIDPKMPSQLPQLVASKRCTKLIGGNPHIGPAAEPRLHFLVQAGLLELRDQRFAEVLVSRALMLDCARVAPSRAVQPPFIALVA